MLEAENYYSLTVSSQPSLVGQAEMLDKAFEEPCIYAVYYFDTAGQGTLWVMVPRAASGPMDLLVDPAILTQRVLLAGSTWEPSSSSGRLTASGPRWRCMTLERPYG
jgi:hypothetical protein